MDSQLPTRISMRARPSNEDSCHNPLLLRKNRWQKQEARAELEELQRKKAALSLELMSLEDASRNLKQGIRGPGVIPASTEASGRDILNSF